jgi:hypothetical protein
MLKNNSIDAISGLRVGKVLESENDAVAGLEETAYVDAGCICGLYRFKMIALASDSS